MKVHFLGGGRWLQVILKILQAGWWFGCHFLFSHIVGISSSQLTFIFFRGVAQPPTSKGFKGVDSRERHLIIPLGFQIAVQAVLSRNLEMNLPSPFSFLQHFAGAVFHAVWRSSREWMIQYIEDPAKNMPHGYLKKDLPQTRVPKTKNRVTPLFLA